MYRQSSSRNHRSKRIRVRHVLQVCLLLAVSLWLIYQVKHSHDQKKESEEIDEELDVESGGGFIRIGRKDFPKVITKMKDRFESVEDEETSEEEVDEIKHEEEFQEDKKSEDGETDDRKLEKLDAEVDREEDIVDDEKDVDEQALRNEKREDKIDEADDDEIQNSETPSNVANFVTGENSITTHELNGNLTRNSSLNDEINKDETPSSVANGVTGENSTITHELNGNLTRNSSLFLQNATEIVSGLDFRFEEVNNSTIDAGNNPPRPSSLGRADPSNSIEASMEDEVLKSEKTENPERFKADSVVLPNSSNSIEEKMVHANPVTVPKLQQTEANSPKGVVAL